MPFDINNVGSTYQKAMIAMFHDVIHVTLEVYVDDVLVK